MVVPGNNRFVLIKPHCGVASAGMGVNAPTISAGAMRSSRIENLLN
jgi:hypothetical protein